MEIKTRFVEFKASVDADGVFEGYGSVFGNVDHHGDVVAKGAFARSLAEHKSAGRMPALLWQHDQRQPIGVYDVVKEDDRGLYVKGRLALKTQTGAEAYELMKMGAVTGLSIGYRVREYTHDREKDVYTLTDVDLMEVSPVTLPANDSARISVVKNATSVQTEREFERFLRDAGFSKSEATAIASHGWAGAKRREADAAESEELQKLNESLSGLLSKLKP